MKQETHKEQMERLKEFDPITYYEMSSDPTGSDSDDGDGCFMIILGVIVIICTLFYFFRLKMITVAITIIVWEISKRVITKGWYKFINKQ